jgi:hypothetical protein
MKTLTLAPNLIQTKQAEAIKNQTLRKDCQLGDIKLVSETHVEIGGHMIKITKNAYRSLIKTMGLPSTFTSRLDRLFNKESKTEFINVLSKAIQLSGKSSISVHVSPTDKKIVGFSGGSTLITNKTFFDFSNDIINEQGFKIVDIFNDEYTGGTTINTILDRDVNIKGMTNETFHAGLTFKNNPLTGIMVSPHIKRLWCANGCTSEMASESYQLNDLTGDSQEKFIKHLHEMRKNGFVPSGYADTVREANQTTASINELQQAYRAIEPHVGERANSILQMDANKSAYTKAGYDVNLMSPDQKKSAKSNQSIWSIANAMTWVANNADQTMNTNIQDSDKTDLQIKSGNLLSKKWDHKNAFANPFGDLNQDNQIGLHLN